MGKQTLRRLVSAGAMFSAMLMVAAPSAAATPAEGSTIEPAAPVEARFVGNILGVESRCNASVYRLCLYYNSSMATAWWATTVDRVNDLAPYRFWAGTGAGEGEPVKNNAAAVSCDIARTSKCIVFFNSNQMGNRDWLYGQQSGRLQLTYNENASVGIYY